MDYFHIKRKHISVALLFSGILIRQKSKAIRYHFQISHNSDVKSKMNTSHNYSSTYNATILSAVLYKSILPLFISLRIYFFSAK